MTRQGSRSLLSIQFKNAYNLLRDHTPDYMYVERHRFNFDSVFGSLIYRLRAQLARVSGELNYLIPNDWWVLQPHRFPVINVQGTFVLGGESYRVQGIDNIGVSRSGVTLDEDNLHTIFLKSATGKEAILVVAPILELAEKPEARLYVSLSTDKGIFEAFLPASQSMWMEDEQTMTAHFDQLALKSSFSGDETVLTASLMIPKANARLSLNNQPLPLKYYDGQANAFVRNNQKNYSVYFSRDGKSSSLTLSQEGSAVLAAKYELDGETYRCGTETLSCAGLTLDADQKTYRFNNVKLGAHTLNGSVFIPGVFE